MTGYINKFDEDKNKNKNKNKNTITMALKVKDKQLSKKLHKKNGKKIEKLMSINFNSKKKYIKTKIETYEDSIKTNFHNKKGLNKYQKKIYHINVYQQ